MSAETMERSTQALVEDSPELPRAERTKRLLEAADSSSGAARSAILDRVVEINMPVAAQIAGRYHHRGVASDDLEQVAYLALTKAVQRYEYSPDRDFLSFAVPTIRGELRRYFRDFGWTIRPTRRVQDAQRRIAQAESDLCQVLGRAPRPSEIAERLDIDLDTVVEALSANGLFQPSTLDQTIIDGAPSLAQLLSIEEQGFHDVEARAMLAPLMSLLTERERLLLELRFFHDLTQAEIGKQVGLSQMQVSRLLSDLMSRMRDELSTPPPEQAAGAA